MRLKIFVDGASRPNSGPSTVGLLVRDSGGDGQAREFKSSLDVAFNIMAGQLSPAATNGKTRHGWVEERRRLGKKKRRENKREKRQRQYLKWVTQLQNTCDRLEILVVGVVFVLSGRLDEANLDHHPARERWQTLYQEELATHQEGGASARQLKHHQAE